MSTGGGSAEGQAKSSLRLRWREQLTGKYDDFSHDGGSSQASDGILERLYLDTCI